MLMKKHAILSSLLEAGKVKIDRYSRTEIKYETTFDIVEAQKIADNIAQQIRKIDTNIQEKNWTAKLAE